MRGFALKEERIAAAKVIDGSGFARAWYWERDANAGPYCSEQLCLGMARTSDGLVLLLASDITPITQREFMEARKHGVPCFVFQKDDAEPDDEVRAIVDLARSDGITVKFRNISELQTQILSSIYHHITMVHRKDIHRRHWKAQRNRLQVTDAV
jgi:hypothetical protein